ncbi:MAG: flagellin N-terminal helical domain-containing protein [Acidimicrobiales bacterium]
MTDAMRVTPLGVSQQLVADLLSQQSSISQLEEQISTGYKVNQPSDNPAATTAIMRLQASSTRFNQYVSNAGDALGWLGTANNVSNGVLTQLNQVEQLTLSATSAQTNGQSALDALAQQVLAVRSNLLELANTTYNNQPIFSGTANVTAAYDATGTYLGGGPVATRTVAPGVSVAVGVTGPAMFGTGAAGLLSNVPGSLGVLAQIASDLQSGNISAVEGTDLSNLQNAVDVVQNQAGIIGAAYRQAQTFQQEATSNLSSLSGELATLQDTNMTQAITELKLRQSSYQAGLWATAQVGQLSLVSFLG